MKRSLFYGAFAALTLLFCSQASAIVEYDSVRNSFRWQDELDISGGGGGGTGDAPPSSGGGTPTDVSSTPVPVKPAHFSEIKQAVDIAATKCNIADDVWLNADMEEIAAIGRSGHSISASQINGIRSAITELYSQAGQAAELAGYPSVNQRAGSFDRIYKSHVQDMRDALDGLSAVCAAVPPAPVCGNGGAPEAGEQCDDGNIVNGDGCSSTCQNEAPVACLDGGQQIPDPPVCVDRALENNTVAARSECCAGLADVRCSSAGAALRLTCRYECGNGRRESGETCDDGNTVSGDGCSSACICEATCGNGAKECNEYCDDGNTTSGDGCSSTCGCEPVCGDGRRECGEGCDDGNVRNGDGCSSSCVFEDPEVCGCVQFVFSSTNPGASNWDEMGAWINRCTNSLERAALDADMDSDTSGWDYSCGGPLTPGPSGRYGNFQWAYRGKTACPADHPSYTVTRFEADLCS